MRKRRKTQSKVFRAQKDISEESWQGKLNMRNTPEIKFVMDQSIAYGVAMSKMIDDVTRDLKEEEE